MHHYMPTTCNYVFFLAKLAVIDFFQILLDKKVICNKEMATGNATDLFLPTLDLLLTKILMGTLCDVVFLFHDKCMQI